MIRALLAVLLLALVGPSAWAADDYSSGVAALGSGRYADAATSFSRWTATHPADADAAVLLGIARYHAGDPRGATAALRRGLAGGTRYASRALYYLGLSASAIGDASAARDAFARLEREHPRSVEAAKIARTVEGERGGPGQPERDQGAPQRGSLIRPFRFFTLDEVGYDTNPALFNNPQSVPSQDPRAFLFDFASLRLDVPRTPLFLVAEIVNRDYFGNDANDYQAIRGRFGADLDLAADWRLTPRYSYTRSWFGRNPYEVQNEVSARLSVVSGRVEAAATPFWERRDHSGVFADQDGNEEGLDLRIGWRVNRLLKLLRFGVEAGHRQAKVDYLGYDEVEPRARAVIALPWKLDLDLVAAFRWRRYAALNPGFGTTRDDRRVDGSVRLTRPVSRWLSVEASAEGLDNRSNIASHAYRDGIYSIGVEVFF